MGGWGLKNPYGVRILNPLEIIGRSLIGTKELGKIERIAVKKHSPRRVRGFA